MPRLHELLGTKKKGEQETRVEQLMAAAQTPVLSIMVLLDQRSGRLDIRAAGVDNAEIATIKSVLRYAIDQLTAQEAMLQQEQQVVKEEPDGSDQIPSEPMMPFPEDDAS